MRSRKKVKLLMLQQKVKSLKHGVKERKQRLEEPLNSKRAVVEHGECYKI